MITAAHTHTSRPELYAAYNRRLTELLAAQKEIARLSDRVKNLQTENQLLSYRLVENDHI